MYISEAYVAHTFVERINGLRMEICDCVRNLLWLWGKASLPAPPPFLTFPSVRLPSLDSSSVSPSSSPVSHSVPVSSRPKSRLSKSSCSIGGGEGRWPRQMITGRLESIFAGCTPGFLHSTHKSSCSLGRPCGAAVRPCPSSPNGPIACM